MPATVVLSQQFAVLHSLGGRMIHMCYNKWDVRLARGWPRRDSGIALHVQFIRSNCKGVLHCYAEQRFIADQSYSRR